MQILYSFQRLMGDILLFILLSSAFTVAFQLDALPRNVASLFRRSLPGSLAYAPAGAIGYYQPPPGPITHAPLPKEDTVLPTSTREISHELRQVASATGTVPASLRALEASATRTSTATTTESVAASTSSGVANKEAVFGVAGIFVPALLAMLQI